MRDRDPNHEDDTSQLDRERLSLIVDSARLGTWDWNIETGELWWSRACLEMFGLAPDTRMSYGIFLETLHPEDRERVDQAVRRALEEPQEYSVEMRAVWPDGTVRWVASRGRAYFNEAGQAIRMSGAAVDIDRLKDTEENLRLARAEAKAESANLAALLEAVPGIAFFSQDPECRVMSGSRYAHETFGLPFGANISMTAPPEQRHGMTILENGVEVAPEDLPMQQAARTGREMRNRELQIRTSDGRVIWIFGNAVPLFDAAGNAHGAMGAYLDITERKLIEERLRRTTERFQIALRGSPITVSTQDLDLRYRWVYNPGAGFNAADMIGKTDRELLQRPEDAAQLEAIKSEVIRTGRNFKGEVSVYHQGIVRSYHITVEAQRDEKARIIGLTCASFDFTERKLWEAEREKLSQRHQFVLDAVRMGWWHYDAATNQAEWDRSFSDIFGIQHRLAPVDDIVRMVHPEDVSGMKASFMAAMDPVAPKPCNPEFRIIRADGSMRWVQAYAQAEFTSGGSARQLVSFSGTLLDVTERKASEEALRQSERQLASEASSLVKLNVWSLRLWRSRDLQEGVRTILATAIELVGADKGNFQLYDPQRNVLKPAAQEGFEQDFFDYFDEVSPETDSASARVLNTRERVVIEDIESDPQYAPWRETARKAGYAAVVSTPLIAGEGTFTGVVSTHFATPHRPSEQDLRRLDLYMRQASNFIERFKIEDALRASEARYRELAETLDRQVQSRTKELQHRTDELTLISEGLRELSGRLLRIQDEERRRIARELHDSAGQFVTALDLELSNLADEIRKAAPHLVRNAEDAESLVQQLHRELRTTSYLLHPPLLDEAGLFSAVTWYAQGMSERSGIQVDVDMARDFGRLPRELELAVFRLLQESLTNIHRHSSSKTARIRLEHDRDTVTVEVQDQGKGISSERLAEIQSGGSGVGIRGMRERLRQFHGDLAIESTNSGTRVVARVPIPHSSAEAEGRESLRAIG